MSNLSFQLLHVEDFQPRSLMDHEQPLCSCPSCEEAIFESELELSNRCPNCGSKFDNPNDDEELRYFTH